MYDNDLLRTNKLHSTTTTTYHGQIKHKIKYVGSKE